jgi:hypothetical protein
MQSVDNYLILRGAFQIYLIYCLIHAMSEDERTFGVNLKYTLLCL